MLLLSLVLVGMREIDDGVWLLVSEDKMTVMCMS